MDGANAWKRFWHITVPCMSPIIFYNLLMALITNLQVITPALALTKGGPGNASNMLLFYVYQKAFDQTNYGMASAITVVVIVLLLILTCVQFFTQDKRTFYA